MVPIALAQAPMFHAEFVSAPSARFPEVHASNWVELPNGDLYVTWYAGSKEKATDVAVLAARKPQGATAWTEQVVIADDPERSEGNPVPFVAPDGRLLLFYATMHGDGWATCKVKVQSSTDQGATWSPATVLIDELGFMPRSRVLVLDNGDWLLPLYDRRGDTAKPKEIHKSLVYISSDQGKSWTASPLVSAGPGLVQPTIIQRADQSLLMLLRSRNDDDKGRIWQSESTDRGRTWSPPRETVLPNPDASVQVTRLANGHLVLAFNNTPKERSPLSLALSTDEGRTWPVIRDLETEPGEYSYPSIAQTRDGLIHVTYTNLRNHIKHVVLDEAWITAR